jgi:hypothetical protein
MMKNISWCVICGVLFLSSACSKKRLQEDRERMDISGIWILKNDVIPKKINENEVASTELIRSDVILISYDGDGYYSVKSIKDIGQNPKLGPNIVMKLEFEAVSEATGMKKITLLTDAYHFLRFSSNQSPTLFDLEVRENKTASNEINWKLSGSYMRCD